MRVSDLCGALENVTGRVQVVVVLIISAKRYPKSVWLAVCLDRINSLNCLGVGLDDLEKDWVQV